MLLQGDAARKVLTERIMPRHTVRPAKYLREAYPTQQETGPKRDPRIIGPDAADPNRPN